MFPFRKYFVPPLVAAGIAAMATIGLFLAHGDREIPLLVFLPGIALVDYLFGALGGVSAVAFSVLGTVWFRSVKYQTGYMPHRLYVAPRLEDEIILLLVGLFTVWIMEQRRKSGEQAQSGQQQFWQLLQTMPDAVLIFDRDARLIKANPAAYRMSGRSPEEILGKTAGELRQLVYTSGNEPAHRTIEDALQGKTTSQIEFGFFDREKKRQVKAVGSAAPLRNARQHITGAILLITDVTDLHALQGRLSDIERHQLMGRMAAGITHDFNNILEVVEKAATVLDMVEESPGPERRRYVEMIHHAAMRGAETIGRLRDYLAGGTGEMTSLNINDAVRDAVELTRPLWKGRRNVEVIAELGEVPEIRGNMVDLRRVLTNLIFNALEAIGDAEGTVKVHTEFDAPRVRCWVEDSGPGIPQEQQEQLFMPYHTTKPSGTGLGLSSAQKIILAHGGNFTFYSEHGRGTRFNIELPVQQAKAGGSQTVPTFASNPSNSESAA